MRKSTAFNFFLLFAALLLVHRIPGVLADQCLMSGSDRVIVDMGLGGELQADTTPHFTADLNLNSNLLQITGHGVVPSCIPGKDMSFTLTKNPEDTETTLVGTFSGTATKINGAPGYNYLDFRDFHFGTGTATLVGNRVEVNVGKVLFDTALIPYIDPFTGKKYVKITNPIPLIGKAPIPGPRFYLTDGVTCGPSRVANAIYIPVTVDNDQWSLDFKCGDRTFGPVLYNRGPVIPTLSGLGLLVFSVCIFGMGIWAMRKARFGNTMAGT